MNSKLDENLPVELEAVLRAMGQNTDTVAGEGRCGAPDSAVVEAASAAQGVLLTLDKGIADIRCRNHAGVVLFRPDKAGRKAVLAFVRERIGRVVEMDVIGRLKVVGPSRIRFR